MKIRSDYLTASPEGYRAFGKAHHYVATCGIDPQLLHLIYLRVSQINGCAYCVDLHARDALKCGVSQTKLNQLVVFEESREYSAKEKAALAWAECLTLLTQTHAPDEAYERVSGVFSEKAVADLSYAIALMNAFNRLGVGFRQLPESSKRDAASDDG